MSGSGTTGHAVVECNRKDGGKRKYILVEQGDYFEQVTQQRMQKITYSNTWKNGKATTSEAGVSQAFKILKLEGYEDTLNNLQLHRNETQQNLINILPETDQGRLPFTLFSKCGKPWISFVIGAF